MARLKIGVIGCGAIAQIQHLPHLRELDDQFEIGGLADLSPKLLEAGYMKRQQPVALCREPVAAA